MPLSILKRPFPIVVLTAFAMLVIALLGETAAAGGHTGGATPERMFDPAKRSDLRGTVLVTGANRGIGLALANNYAKRGWTVIATARSPNKADELNALAAANDNVRVERMDLLDHDSIDALAEKLRDVPIDVLLNNAAIMGDAALQDFGNYDYAEMANVFAVNVAGTLKMSEAFVDHVAASNQKKIVGITSVQGSIASLRDPLIPFYKMSKTALNMGMSSVAKIVKRKKITIALISPGAVDTRMMNAALDHANYQGKSFMITTEESAEAVINVIDQYERKHSGMFLAHTGEVLPW
jgi:NAD(P)-dependent dehydrogenase (short-subunit alcohol dehydrogenase family)